MKRTLLLLLVVFCMIILVACGSAPVTNETSGDDTEQNQADGEDQNQSNDPVVEIVFQEVQKYKDSLDYVSADYLAEIKNTGSVPVQISNVSIELNDVNGSLIGVTDYVSIFPDIINPGESAYVFENIYDEAFDAPAEMDTIGEAVLRYTVDKSDEREDLSVELSDTKLQMTAYDEPEMIGRVINTGESDLEYIYIIGVVRDAEGTLQNVIFTIVDSLPAGQDAAFSQTAIFGFPDADYSASTIDYIMYAGF